MQVVYSVYWSSHEKWSGRGCKPDYFHGRFRRSDLLLSGISALRWVAASSASCSCDSLQQPLSPSTARREKADHRIPEILFSAPSLAETPRIPFNSLLISKKKIYSTSFDWFIFDLNSFNRRNLTIHTSAGYFKLSGHLHECSRPCAIYHRMGSSDGHHQHFIENLKWPTVKKSSGLSNLSFTHRLQRRWERASSAQPRA